MNRIAVYGHSSILSNLQKSIEQQTLASALLFSGLSGIGKKQTALNIVQFALCSSKPACGQCTSCKQVQEQTHPALLFIEPDGLNIKMEVVRKIRNFISLQSFSQNRWIIIDQAHRMNHHVQNALLKSLEEPPSNVHFILVCDQWMQLLPTIRSRTQCFRFQRLDIRSLQKIFPEESEQTLRSSRGQTHRVHQWKDQQELYGEVFQFWHRLFHNKKISHSLSKALRKRPSALLVARTFQEILRDARLIKEGSTNTIHPPMTSIQWNNLPSELIHEWYTQALQLEEDILSYLDSLLCFENFWHQAHKNIQALKITQPVG